MIFLSTLSLRRATIFSRFLFRLFFISIHALLAESDLFALLRNLLHNNFYPRSPCGERQDQNWASSSGPLFLSTLSLRRATIRPYQRHFPLDISIHALLAESDHSETVPRRPHAYISIHALLAESDEDQNWASSSGPLFLSTLSLRRATHHGTNSGTNSTIFLSTLSLRRATCLHPFFVHLQNISIHALLAESDRTKTGPAPLGPYFYPRSPCGERPITAIGLPLILHFYPRSPCGERRDLANITVTELQFLSTLSLRRATPHGGSTGTSKVISIHALLAESDYGTLIYSNGKAYFYPRSPCGERRKPGFFYTQKRKFLSTLSLRRATGFSWAFGVSDKISIHALLAESDSSRRRVSGSNSAFLSTLSLRRATQQPV